MRRTVRQSRLIAPGAEPIAETSGGERTAQGRHKERQIPTWGGIDDALQLGKNRQHQRDRLAVAVLELREMQPAIAHVLPTEAHHIAATLPREQEKCEREPSLGPNRMPRLELLHFLRCPGVKALAIGTEIFH